MKINYSSNRNSVIQSKGDLIRDFIWFADFYNEPEELIFKNLYTVQLEFVTDNYVNHIKKVVQLDFLPKLDALKIDAPINSLDDILDKEQQLITEMYINNISDDENGNQEYEMLYDDFNLDMVFERYLDLRNINDGVFISYVYMKVKHFIESIQSSIQGIVDEINLKYDFLELISESIKAEYINFHKSQIVDQYFLNLKNNIQIYGFFDERGVFIDGNLTLKNALKYYNIIDNDVDYGAGISESLIKSNLLSYLKYRYFYYKFFGAEPDALFDKSKQYLKEEFEKFKRENSKLITFLSNKSFSNREIEIILNLLSINRYSELEIRSINLNKQITVFRALWLFGIFEFFTVVENHRFESIKDFEVLLKLNLHNDYDLKSYGAQFKKYYDFIHGTNQSDNPFNIKSTENLLNNIEESLSISREKLNPLPK